MANTATTFTSLQRDVRNYLERGFTTGADPIVFEEIPRLITLAERRLARDIKIQGFQEQITTILQPGVAVYQKPDRWRDTVSVNISYGPNFSNRIQLYLRSYEYCRSMFPQESSLAQPLYFSDYNYLYWFLTPTPDIAYPMEILYYELPALLDETRQSNWFTQYAPNALLYAVLLEATPFLKNDERIPIWQQFYQQAVQALNQEDQGKIINRGAIRSEA